MRGKSKFYIKLSFVMVALICFGFALGAFIAPTKIKAVNADDYNHNYCSQKYDDGIVFSVEQVYFDNDAKGSKLYLNNGANGIENPISNIKGYGNNDNFFLNYGGTNADASKRVIYNGDYAMLYENATRSVYKNDGTTVTLNQGIMVTLGGYVFDESGKLHTNSEVSETITNPDDSTTDVLYSSKIKDINLGIKRNGEKFADGASLRTYDNGLHFDFVYFLDASQNNEGFYEITFDYMLDGGTRQYHTFNFYVLLSNEYFGSEVINGQEYSKSPQISNATLNSSKYEAFVNADQYPVLTYDYKHYDVAWSYVVNDLLTSVKVKYETFVDSSTGEIVEQLAVTSTTHGESSTVTYNCKEFTENDMVSFVFGNVGEYTFSFNYVYYNTTGTRLEVKNLNYEKINLQIYGYELKYAKTGFASSDLRKVNIVKNGTMVIPVNGYINNEVERDESLALGYMYEFVTDSKVKSGTIAKTESANVDSNNDYSITDKKLTWKKEPSSFVETDHNGLWLNLNDEYDLIADSERDKLESFYIYNPTLFKTGKEYVTTPLTKTTSFVKTGYYFVKADYIYGENTTNTQYFAFRILSGVVDLKMYTTEEETIPTVNGNRLYSNQFTNKNVYANWEDPSTFSSNQTATIYYVQKGRPNVYASKQDLIKFSDGQANVNFTSEQFVKNETLITETGSYLLVVTIEAQQAKSYYYFTIDKENISGVDILGVSSAQIGNNSVYNVARDKENNPISYTNKVVVDKNFTIWWNNKNSGAQIVGTYTYTPFSYDSATDNMGDVEGTDNGNYLWKINGYKFDNTSNLISIEKPATKSSTLDAANVLTKQGVYWFELIDEAGNKMNYMIILDKTQAEIDVKTNTGNDVNSGDMVAESVTVEFGTHKALLISSNKDDLYTSNNTSVASKIVKLLDNNFGENYYSEQSSNLTLLNTYFGDNIRNGKKELYLLVENEKGLIDVYSGVNKDATIYTTNPTNTTESNITINNYHNIKIELDETEHLYTIMVVGNNQIDKTTSVSKFEVTLNPDKAEGKVLSSASAGEDIFKLDGALNTTDAIDGTNYCSGQSSNDGVFMFQWVNNEGTDYEVGKVSYTYYPLMTQELLDEYKADDAGYNYYPYDINSPTEFVIYDAKNNIKNYTNVNNSEKDPEDLTKTVYRSIALNVGNVLYYDENGNLFSDSLTLPGMYVIKREYIKDIQEGSDAKDRYFVFFVDRNKIIDYSTTSTAEKTTGKYIDLYLQQGLVFNNFTQEVGNYELDDKDYKIYLQTNRLPLEIRVPTGKYASSDGSGITKTSANASAGLTMDIKFVDTYNWLGLGRNANFTLFRSNGVEQSNGYITYKLSTDNLNWTDDNSTNILNYLSACNQTGNNWLSLPGIYIVTIYDTVFNAKQRIEGNKCVPAEFNIGIEITKDNPIVDLYASSSPENGQNADYANFNDQNTVFSTNKAYIRYDLNLPDKDSFDAQVDSAYIFIERTENGATTAYYDSKTNTGIINKDSYFSFNGTDYKNIQYVENNKYVVWLDSGLTIKDGKITDYKEYSYKIYVRYILNNGKYTNCYVYNKLENGAVKITEQYYQSEFNVSIDRTAYLQNLLNVEKGQVEFLKEYLTNYTQDNFVTSGKLDSNIYNTVAYRAPDGEDYFAVVNQLYYYYISIGEFEKAEDAMYAFKVKGTDIVNYKDNGKNIELYYRPLYNGNAEKDQRLALLPISEQYYNNVTDFAVFSKVNNSNFTMAELNQSFNENEPSWNKLLKLNQFSENGYYEIIEIDSAGNYTQYIIYVEQISENITIKFEDATTTHSITFDFNSQEIKLGDKVVDTITLIPFNGIENTISDTQDWFYKINLINLNNADESYVYFMNNNNKNLKEFLENKLKVYANQNWQLTITDRYNAELTLTINIYNQAYALNTANFKPIQDSANWFLRPSDLNTKIDETGGTFYVKIIEITNLTNGTKAKFELNSDGIITDITPMSDKGWDYKGTQEGYSQINLQENTEYQVTLIDCAGVEYGPYKIHTNASGYSDHSITATGEYNVINNVFYSANPVEIKYNKNVYSNIVIEVYKNNDYFGTWYDGFNYNHVKVEVEGGANSKFNTITLYPYDLIEDLGQEGELLEFKVYLMFNGQEDQVYNVVLDNRLPEITLLNGNGEDRSNIIKTTYENYKEKKVEISPNKLFEMAPELTLSETVVLGWSKFDPSIYKNEVGTYYYGYMFLVEFITKQEYKVYNLTGLDDQLLNISPKEYSLGRYVLVNALYKDNVTINEGDKATLISNGLICYKAYSFSISVTANAMYEIQDSSGQVVESNSSVVGSDVLAVIREQLSVDNDDVIKTALTLTDDEYTKLSNQTLPLYVLNDTFNLVPNGDNGISTLAYSCKLTENETYNFYLYKVYSSVHSTFVAVLKVKQTSELITAESVTPEIRYVYNNTQSEPVSLIKSINEKLTDLGTLYFTNFYRGGVIDAKSETLNLVKKNSLYLEVYYKYAEDNIKYVGKVFGQQCISDDNNYGGETIYNFVNFNTSGTYIIYLKDLAGNTRTWTNGITQKENLTLTILNEVIVSVNGEIPVDYNYYNGEVKVDVLFANSGYYDYGSVRIEAYRNGSSTDYISASGSKNNITSFVFTEFGTYRVKVEAKVNEKVINKILVFSIINADEARIALDLTQISNHQITKVVNTTTGMDVTDTFIFLINEGFIYSKLITYDRLSAESAFGSTMGKQTFEVFYTVNSDVLVPSRDLSFKFTVNNQTPSMQSSIAPGESTTKDIVIKFNALTIYRQVGACYIVVNDTVMLPILSEETAIDGTASITLSEVGVYYVKIVTDSGRVLSSFKVTIKEPLNSWSFFVIIAVVLVIVGIVVTFIILRTRMRVR